jgi:hypothetical protein
LIALWSSAPFLLGNTVGPFDPNPSVASRMKSFDASIEQMLWPERREHDAKFGDKVPGTIDRTTERSWVTIPVGFVPEALRPLQGWGHRLLPWLIAAGGDITLGPVPKDTPVGLLANLKLRSESDDLSEQAAFLKNMGEFAVKLKFDLATAPADASDEELRKRFANLREPMMALSKCPDLVVNRGHYFGTAQFNRQDGLTEDEKSFGTETALSDDDKRALIAFLKTF